jgi:AcrR family transcriptional regulator
LKGARHCIEQIGYARTTSRDVAAAAGVSLGAIGYHFGSKEELLNEAIAEGFRDWTASFVPLVSESGTEDLGAVASRAIPQFFRLLDDNRPLLVAFIEAVAQAEHVPALRAQLANQYRESRATAVDMITTTLGPQVAEAGLSADTLSSLVLALVDGLILQHLVDPDTAPRSADVLALFGALTHGDAGPNP